MSFSICPSVGICTSKPTVLASSVAAMSIDCYSSVAEIPFQDWQSLSDKSSYLELAYLEAMEESGKDTQFRYLVLKENRQTILIANCQIVKFDMRKTARYTQGANLNSWTEKVQYFISRQLKRLVANIEVNLWVCGNLFLSGEYGYAHSHLLSEQEALDKLLQAIELQCKKEPQRIVGVLLKDFYESNNDANFAVIERDGFHPFRGDPIMKLEVQPHWLQFEDYLNDLSSKYRQRAKSAFKKSQSLTVKTWTLEDVLQYNETLFPLFENVVSKSSFNLKTTPHEYFISLKKYLPEQVKIDGYFEGERLVGFKTTILTNTHLEAHFLGYTDEDNHTYKLYQRMLYDMIRAGIEAKTPYISFGRTAIEIKTTVGAMPEDAVMFLKTRNRLINRIAGSIIRNIPTDPYTPRHPFKGQEHLEPTNQQEN